MHVVATAGHVDHGKSALVEALTGAHPDRLAEERRRGLTIQLGYCWTSLPEVGPVAFVDVPGHERFVPTMLSGIGPVPAVLLVVAADDPWMPQAAEHLAALDALEVRHGVVAVTRADLADPRPAAARAREELSRTTLHGAPVVPVSARTGAGLDLLRDHLVALVRDLEAPDPGADVRLWVDRRFTVRGAGTVVTGTLPAGTVTRGDLLAHEAGVVRVRGVQALGAGADAVAGVARVALNVTGDEAGLDRGGVLVTPEAYRWTDLVDVRVTGEARDLPAEPMLHVGATSLPVRSRPLGAATVRLTLARPLPLRVGDRALLRDPGDRRLWGLQVLDPQPPTLRRRGAAAARARTLAGLSGRPDPVSEVERREVVDDATLRRLGVGAPGSGTAVVRAGAWSMSPARAARAAEEAVRAVRAHDRAHPLDPGVPLGALAGRLRLPVPELVAAVVAPPLSLAGGRVVDGVDRRLPDSLERALDALDRELAGRPFAAPPADRLTELGLDPRSIAAASRSGRLLRLAPAVVLLPDAERLAVEWLRELPQPFTASEARARLGTSRRVVLPLLDRLDRQGLTTRLPDDRRRID